MQISIRKRALLIFGLLCAACCMSAGIAGCGVEVKTKKTAPVITETAPVPNTFRLRWFPVEDAVSYKLYIEQPSGNVVKQSEVTPAGCTHAAKEGFTSGVCAFDYQLPDPAAGSVPYTLRLTAIDGKGSEGPAATKTLPGK